MERTAEVAATPSLTSGRALSAGRDRGGGALRAVPLLRQTGRGGVQRPNTTQRRVPRAARARRSQERDRPRSNPRPEGRRPDRGVDRAGGGGGRFRRTGAGTAC